MYRDTDALERTNYINLEIYKRNIPSEQLQPYLYIEPVSTRCKVMPIFDFRKKCNVDMEQKPTFDIKNNFNPGNKKSPNF